MKKNAVAAETFICSTNFAAAFDPFYTKDVLTVCSSCMCIVCNIQL